MIKAEEAIKHLERGQVVNLTDSEGRRMKLVWRDGEWFGISEMKTGTYVRRITGGEMLYQDSDWDKLASQLQSIQWRGIKPHVLKKIALILKENK